MPTFKDAAFAISPGLHVPPEYTNYLLLAFYSIAICNFTTTYKHPLLPYVRLLLAIPALYASWCYGFPSDLHVPNRRVYVGMGMVGTYGTMRVIEVCFVGFWNRSEDWPKWVKLRAKGDQLKRAPAAVESRQRASMEVIPSNPTILGRLAYAFDLMGVTGPSWRRGRAWNFAPPSVLRQDAEPVPRLQFIATSLRRLVECYLAMDVIETIVSLREWDTHNTRPVTSLPLHLQLVYAFCVCAMTCMEIALPYNILASISGIFFNAPSTAFTPLFDAPFASRSLGEFWSAKWHPIFRRIFDRDSYGMLSVFLFITKALQIPIHPRAVKVVRSIFIFGLSYTLHLCLFASLPTTEAYPALPFVNIQAAKFFLSQPLGLTIEFLVVFPLTQHMPPPLKTFVRRLFAWSYLLWSGRYWADVWMNRGMLGYAERNIVFSPVRGILRGQWAMA